MSDIPEMPPVTVSVPIPGDLLTRIDDLARRDLTSRAAVARLAMLKFVDEELPLDEWLEENEFQRSMAREGASTLAVAGRIAAVDIDRREKAASAKKKGRRG